MPDITASLGYLADLALYQEEKPFGVVVEAGTADAEAEHLTNVETETRDNVTIFDIRGQEEQFSLDSHGFVLLPHESKCLNLDSAEMVHEYTKETEDFLKKTFLAEDAVCWNLKVC